MSVIIRLQNLAWSANALDIRQFFRGLSIPEGGVHIVGGELGDAFIAFSTDEDARQAMMQDGGKIKEMKIKLFLSSRTEMQKVIEAARQQTLSLQSFIQTPVAVTQPVSAVSPAQSKSSDSKKDDKSDGRKDRRDRSRSKERSRSRDRDRDRDRRDRDRGRRRRDRSRSRDRDRDRDRRSDRDRRRRRDRSRSRDRTRSRDRDSKRSNDRRKESNEEDNSDVVCVAQFQKDKAKLGVPENGIWEVPPQTQMQAALLATNLLGNNIAALAQDGDSRSLPFNAPVGQFGINGLSGVGGLMPNSTVPGMGLGMAAMGRNRDHWDNRGDNSRFPRNQFNNQEGYGPGNGFRGNNRNNNNSFINKVQELDSRRNPHAFQSGNSQYSKYESNDRNSRNSNSNRYGSNSHGTCVEVRNMPLNASYQDLRHTFQGIFIRKDGMKIINDNQGNRVGIAYVRFGTPEGKEQAMKGPRYVRNSEVEVLHLDDIIFDKAVDSFSPKDNDDVKMICKTDTDSSETDVSASRSIKVDKLPSYTKTIDVVKLFNDKKVDDIFTVPDKDEKGMSVVAYVKFAKSDDAATVAGVPVKMGPKTISPLRISDAYFYKLKSSRDSIDVTSSDCIIMRGLPYQTIDRDVYDFFSDIGIVPLRVHMVLNSNDKPSGECFCEFNSSHEANRALSKSGLPFGKCTVTIELVSRDKMYETLGLEADNMSPMPAMHMPSMPPHFPPMMDSRPRFGGPMHHPQRFAGGFGPPRPPPGLMGMPPRHMMPRHFGPPMTDYVESFGKPGCVISLENVPFKADIDEIISFFSGYEVKRENVIRRYNEKSMPTGDARVAFNSPAEAQRALREFHHCKMRDRTIFMKVV